MYMYVGALVGATNCGGRGIRRAFGPTITPSITNTADSVGETVV